MRAPLDVKSHNGLPLIRLINRALCRLTPYRWNFRQAEIFALAAEARQMRLDDSGYLKLAESFAAMRERCPHFMWSHAKASALVVAVNNGTAERPTLRSGGAFVWKLQPDTGSPFSAGPFLVRAWSKAHAIAQARHFWHGSFHNHISQPYPVRATFHRFAVLDMFDAVRDRLRGEA